MVLVVILVCVPSRMVDQIQEEIQTVLPISMVGGVGKDARLPLLLLGDQDVADEGQSGPKRITFVRWHCVDHQFKYFRQPI